MNLRTTGLDEPTCAILGKLLSVDRLFEQIDLGDCALSDGGEPIEYLYVIIYMRSLVKNLVFHPAMYQN